MAEGGYFPGNGEEKEGMKRWFVILVCASSVAACAQRTVPVGIDFGLFLPSNPTVRDTFGESWWRVGLSPLSFQESGNWKFTTDIAVIGNSTWQGRAVLVPLTFGATTSFGSTADTTPYVVLRAGPYWADVFAPFLGIDATRIGLNTNAALGVSFGERFYVEARYDFFSDFAGLDFSGFFISAGFRLFDVRL